ncbi:hypothetical protein GCM10010411_23070 [Actinomadura fulvescens]|uniref:Uncharacterized protein n=1 Tax=Actinomadura fulvescens TaxID=46160 RepID=A0ABP6C0V6_9ACTN
MALRHASAFASSPETAWAATGAAGAAGAADAGAAATAIAPDIAAPVTSSAPERASFDANTNSFRLFNGRIAVDRLAVTLGIPALGALGP